MLLSQIKSSIIESVKGHDSPRAETLRFLLSAIRNAGIDKYAPKGEEAMTDEDILEVIKKQVKTHKESIEAFSGAGRTELAEKEKVELAILVAYLPKEMSDQDLTAMLTPIARSGEKNFGLLMKQAMALVGGKADGSRVSAILKKLQG
jgi:uncharacterized protein YqeY